MSTQTPSISESQKTVFALSNFANAVRATTGEDLAPLAYKLIQQSLANAAPTIGTWEIVWGPAVNAQPIGKAYRMNTMYVVRNVQSPLEYVVAIAGTNPYSLLDWIVEDGFVHTQVPWIYAPLAAPGAKIALGTAIGLHIHQTFRPEAGLPGTGATLTDFLRTVTGEKVQICVTGHSLGGALAPTVALWLADTQKIPLLWDPHGNATISSLPTAGPTAGNAAFAAHAGEKLGARLTPFYNSIDVIPQAWRETGTPSLSAIPSLYAPSIEPFGLLEKLVGVARFLAKDGDYTPFAGLSVLPGTVNEKIIDPSASNFENFLKQLGYQHVTAYAGWFGLDPTWMPKEPEQAPPALSPELSAALSQESASPGDIVRALHDREPRKLPIGGALVDAPRGPHDPEAARVVDLVVSELQKQGAPSPAS
jgi:hypothetical protein